MTETTETYPDKGTCEERIAGHLAGRTEDVRSMIGWADAWAKARGRSATAREDRARERIDEYPLGISVRRIVRVELSTGGPADYIEADIDSDGEIDPRSLTYHFADWFDHAEREVHPDDRDVWSTFIEHFTAGMVNEFDDDR